MGNPTYHSVPIMSGVIVEVDRSNAFDQDETIVRGKVYCTSVVENPEAHFLITAANNYDVEGP